MALTASKVSSSIATSKMTILPKQHGVPSSVSMTIQPNELQFTCQAGEPRQLHYGCFLTAKTSFSSDALWRVCGKPVAFNVPQRPSFLCLSKAEERCRTYGDCADITRTKIGDEEDESPVSPHGMDSSKGLSEACRFIYNDAKFVNERARSDIVLLSRGIMRLDARARQDVAMLGSEFLKLDARAREDTEKIDRNVKKKAERLQHIATILKDKAQTRLKSAADKHWSDGALEADLRRADFRAKQRAMEDTIMALEFVKNIHEMMVQKVYKFPMRRENNPQSAVNKIGCIMLEKNGRTVDYFPGEVSTDRITIIQEAYKSMASALSEADGIDYTDPEELELLIATLIDLDAMDGKSSVSLLVECSSSPDVNTRQALANALAAAPSMWTLGNAGMGALQRLAEDSNPVIAAAAFKTICELKKQWEIEEGDSYRFMMNEINEGNGEVDNDTNRT